jgi:hypothetical protein
VAAPKKSVRDVAAVVVLEKRGMPVALSDAGSVGREGRAFVMLVLLLLDIGILF